MSRKSPPSVTSCALLPLLAILAGPLGAQAPAENADTAFELRIRPLLATRCFACHSEGVRSGGLALDSRRGFDAGGNSGLPAAQAILEAVKGQDGMMRMPLGSELPAEEIKTLEAWIEQGAHWPADTPKAFQLDKQEDDLWSLQPVADPAPPAVEHETWPAGDIDRFILAKLESEGLQPGPDADRRTLIRRLYLDVIGLPPAPAAVEAFVADESPDAYETLVDRLLASPRYGERWARRWLDVARYADTSGDTGDFPIPQAFRYRNWVIKAFNEDLPYSNFLRYQIAGDLLAQDETEDERYADKVVATGFIALSRRYGNNKTDMHLTIENTIDTLGRGVLGLTVRCARCHDHKFDPITSADYYRLYGIFNSTRYPWAGASDAATPSGLVPLSANPATRQATEDYYKELIGYVHQIYDNKHVRPPDRERFPELDKLIAEAKKRGEDASELIKEREALLEKHAEYRPYLLKGLDWLKQQRDELAAKPPPAEVAFAVWEASPADAAIQRGGDPMRPGKTVARGMVEAVGGYEDFPIHDGSGRRELAEWLTADDNPLTRRVIVNRIWQGHFGRGLVNTPNNFGRRGETPSHPELLDYLASRFADDGWSIKSLHRRILLSRVYRLSSAPDEAALAADPESVYLWRFPPRRLDADAIRDVMLAVSGDLDLEPGQAHPFPAWYVKKFNLNSPFHDVYDTNQRSVYQMTQRLFEHPFYQLFGGPDTNQSTAACERSSLPSQALFLMNSSFMTKRAEDFARHLESGADKDAQRVNLAFETAFGRPPAPDELDDSLSFLARYASAAGGREAAWAAFARTLLSANELFFLQ